MAAWLELNVKWWKLQLHHTNYRIEAGMFWIFVLINIFLWRNGSRGTTYIIPLLASRDCVAQAMELSLIPSDSNNNLDIVGQAMEMSGIPSDMMMNFWIHCEWSDWWCGEKLEAFYILNEILHILLKLN